MTQTLSREQIEWSRKILAALTEDAVMKPGGTFGLKQPEWKNRVDLIIDMALASLDGAELIRAAAMEEAAQVAQAEGDATLTAALRTMVTTVTVHRNYELEITGNLAPLTRGEEMVAGERLDCFPPATLVIPFIIKAAA